MIKIGKLEKNIIVKKLKIEKKIGGKIRKLENFGNVIKIRKN